MPSGFEDKAVDSIDFSKLSDSDLEKIAKSDDRTTAQEKAQAELNRREDGGDTGTSTTTADNPEAPDLTRPPGHYDEDAEIVASSQLPARVAEAGYANDKDPRDVQPDDKITTLVPDDPTVRADHAGVNPDGLSLDPDAGQAQLQAYANAVEESGTIPPSGGPPDDSLTAARVVETAAAEKEALFESQKAAFKGEDTDDEE